MKKTDSIIEKEKALRIVKNLIANHDSKLDTKYLKSHEKIAIIYKCHCVEIFGGEEKYIKYAGYKIELSKKEFKEIQLMFMTEVEKRAHEKALKKINDLENDLKNENL